MPYHESLSRLFTTDRGQDTLGMIVLTLGLFVLIDALVIHPFIWNNQPTLYYFTVKPLWVGLGLAGVAWWLMTNTDIRRPVALVLGGLVGIVYLQLYYTVAPIPMVSGEAVQISLVGNLTEGLVIHYGGFALALAVVLGVTR